MNGELSLQWAAEYEYPLPWHLLPHRHDYHQIFFLTEGRALFRVDGKSFEAEGGQLVVVPSRALHEAENVGKEPLRASELLFSLSDSVLSSRLAGVIGPLDPNETAKHLLSYAVRYGLSREETVKTSAETYLYTALWDMTLPPDGFDKIGCNAFEIDVTGFSEVSCRVVAFVSANYPNQITLDSISEATGYHKSYLCTVFKKDTGVTINEYLNFIRIKHAAEFLTYADCDLNAVCAAVGFLNICHFNRTFKKFLRVPPGHYHRIARSKGNSALLEKNSLSHLHDEPLAEMARQLGAGIGIFE